MTPRTPIADAVHVEPSGWFAVQMRYAYLAGAESNSDDEAASERTLAAAVRADGRSCRRR